MTTDGSFEAFVNGCSTRLLRSAYLLCGDAQGAEDLLQVTMMRTARRWTAARAAPEAYARTVLINEARDNVRRGRRRVHEIPSDANEPRSRTRLTADHAEHVADRDAVLVALAALPQRQREVIVLRFYADLSVKETAEAIGATEGTVMSYTSRAVTRLRELLGDQYERSTVQVESGVQHDHR